MSLPLEGSRDIHDGIIISMVPDICLTPAGGGMVPVPYMIWCRQADAANLANSVRQTDDRSHAVASIVQRCYGDEPGTGGGVYSGTTGAECTPKTWSQTVRAEGRNMVRHLDQWWMNHRNTYGQLFYTKDLNQYATSQPEQISPQMRAVFSSPASSAASAPQIAQLHQADAGNYEGGFCVAPSPFWEGIHNAASMLGFPVVGHKPIYMARPPAQVAAIAPPQTIRVTPNSPCSAIIAAIRAQIAELQSRRQAMRKAAQLTTTSSWPITISECHLSVAGMVI